MKEKYKLFPCCVPVKGYTRSLIYDLQRSKYFICDQEKIKYLIDDKFVPIDKNDSSFINFLIENELVFKIQNDELDLFPDIEFKYDSPNTVISALVHSNYLDLTYLNNLFKLASIGVRYITLIINEISRNEIFEIFKKIEESDFINFQFFIEKDILNEKEYRKISENLTYCKTISFIQINSDNNLILEKIIFKKFNLYDTQSFRLNIELFSENLLYNSYFNKKIFVKYDEIVNNLNSIKKWGNINSLNSDEILTIICSEEYQYLWNISKDIIDVCKDCELRYMCVDNRLPYERNENEWYHKIECNYNPYIAKWEDEEGYRTLAECGVISNENGFSIDHEKIEEINKELWEEEDVTD